MFHVILYQPEIPPNTGNIIRLCANTGSQLHLIRPLGFELDDARLRRAGLDYREWVGIRQYDSLQELLERLGGARLWACSTRARVCYGEARFTPGDGLLFGPETRGLPPDVLATIPESLRLRVPMIPGNRSLNLSNACAVVLYEAWRQQGYAGAT